MKAGLDVFLGKWNNFLEHMFTIIEEIKITGTLSQDNYKIFFEAVYPAIQLTYSQIINEFKNVQGDQRKEYVIQEYTICQEIYNLIYKHRLSYTSTIRDELANCEEIIQDSMKFRNRLKVTSYFERIRRKQRRTAVN